MVYKTKKALVIGINYMYSGCQLNGCINDAKNLGLWLELHQKFKASDIMVMTDDLPVMSPLRPNRENILKAIDWLVRDAGVDDLLFLSFSGHSNFVYDYSDHSPGHGHHIIYVLKRNIIDILDTEIRDKLCSNPGKVICILDCCQSGSIFHLKYKLNSNFTIDGTVENSVSNLIVISSCGDDESAIDLPQGGILTNLFLTKMMATPHITLLEMSQYLTANATYSHPVIHCGGLSNLNERLM